MGVKTKKIKRSKVKLKTFTPKIPAGIDKKKHSDTQLNTVSSATFTEKQIGVSDMQEFIKEFSTLLQVHPVAAKDFLQRVNLRFRKNDTIRTLYQLTENDKTTFVSLVISYMTKTGETGQSIKVKDFDQIFKEQKKSGKTFAGALVAVLDSAFTELRPHLM